jgi:hypothetical protein
MADTGYLTARVLVVHCIAWPDALCACLILDPQDREANQEALRERLKEGKETAEKRFVVARPGRECIGVVVVNADGPKCLSGAAMDVAWAICCALMFVAHENDATLRFRLELWSVVERMPPKKPAFGSERSSAVTVLDVHNH